MATAFTITNSTVGASRAISISDADTIRIINAYAATILPGRNQANLTNGQIVNKILEDFIARLIHITQAYEKDNATPTPIITS